MSSVDTLIARVRSEYREMPGLRLTIAQACRLWQIERKTCAQLLERLHREGFLERSEDGVFALPALQERSGRRRRTT